MVVALFVVWAAVAALAVAGWPRVPVSRPWRAAALVGALTLSLVHQLMFATLAEDAFISFRYAQNLADGNGLVFNIGEKVEGYSNFLWVVLLAAPKAAANADIVLCARVLGIACTLGCVVAAYSLGRRVANDPRAGVLAAILTAAASSLAAYGPSGLETPLFALLVLCSVLAVHAERSFVAGLLVGLATMTRPDGVLIAVVIGCWLGLGELRRQGSWRALGTYLGGVLLLTVPWTTWRLAYYGELIPNAIAAKSGARFGWQLSEGWGYFLGFALAAATLLSAAATAACWLASRRGGAATAHRAVWLLFALAVTELMFFVVTGGDWMPAWRFFAPAMPLLATGISVVLVLAAARAVRSPARGAVAPLLAVAISLPLLVMSVWDPRMRPTIDAWHTQVRELSATGDWIRRTVPAGTVISTFANGALSYAAGPGITVVDQLGLTDAHIARHGRRRARGIVGHLAYDYDYVVNVRKPAIVFVTGSGFYREPTCAVLPAFRRRYVGVSFRDTANGLWALVYLRRGHAPALARRLGADPTFRHVPCPHPATGP